MAGLEVFVRPVVFPNIRPAPAQPVAPADDPEKGFALIRGSGGKHIDLSNSFSSSTSTSQQTEKQRRSDTARVYQKNEDGTINRDNFVDIDVANKIVMDGIWEPGMIPDDEHHDQKWARQQTAQYYQPVKEKDNIEIKKRNVVKKARAGES